MTRFRKLTPNGDALSICLPIDDLREMGVADEDGEIVGEQYCYVEYEGGGSFSVDVLSSNGKSADTEGEAPGLTNEEMAALKAESVEMGE